MGRKQDYYYLPSTSFYLLPISAYYLIVIVVALLPMNWPTFWSSLLIYGPVAAITTSHHVANSLTAESSCIHFVALAYSRAALSRALAPMEAMTQFLLRI